MTHLKDASDVHESLYRTIERTKKAIETSACPNEEEKLTKKLFQLESAYGKLDQAIKASPGGNQ